MDDLMLNEVRIVGGPRDGELVPYVGATMTDEHGRYTLERWRDADDHKQYRYVLRR